MDRRTTLQIMASLLIIVLLYASVSKLLNYDLFVAQLRTHPYLKSYASFIAWMVPVAESIIAICLIVPATRILGFYGATGLLTVFTVYLALMLLTAENLPCSCGGVISSLTWQQHLIFNGSLIGISIAGTRLEQKIRHEEKKTTKSEEMILGI